LDAAKHGEDLLKSIRQHPATSNTTGSTCATREDQLELYRVCPYRLGNVTAVERSAQQLLYCMFSNLIRTRFTVSEG
jgi:hypothetical protein